MIDVAVKSARSVQQDIKCLGKNVSIDVNKIET